MPKQILIVDDEPDIRKVLTFRLKKIGYEVLTATNGEEALKKARQEKADLVILDLLIPKMPGEEVCRQIRKDKKIEKTPVIMLTSKDSDVDKVIGKVIGADCYMTKPFDIDVLVNEIKKLVDR